VVSWSAGFKVVFGLCLWEAPRGRSPQQRNPTATSTRSPKPKNPKTKTTLKQLGMLVVKIGGPAYRIGMGGGAASSVPSGSNAAELDFNAVQRGDAEMSQKLWRVVRRCVLVFGGDV
jgi:phosphoribosylformylglycinamidine synthase